MKRLVVHTTVKNLLRSRTVIGLLRISNRRPLIGLLYIRYIDLLAANIYESANYGPALLPGAVGGLWVEPVDCAIPEFSFSRISRISWISRIFVGFSKYIIINF